MPENNNPIIKIRKASTPSRHSSTSSSPPSLTNSHDQHLNTTRFIQPRPTPDPRTTLFSYKFSRSFFLSAILPLSTCYLCIIASYVWHFDHVANITAICHNDLREWEISESEKKGEIVILHQTHYAGDNILPAISWSIGVYHPQKVIWLFALILHLIPRLVLGPLYQSLYASTTADFAHSWWFVVLCWIVNILQHVEAFSLIAVSMVDIEKHFSSFVSLLLIQPYYISIARDTLCDVGVGVWL
jgi:hypothetical protein